MKQPLPLPKYWGSLEELANSSEHQERVEKEFISPPLSENITAMERRDFLKLMGAGMALASIGCSRRPIEKIIPYVNKPETIVPGVANWYATTCGECAAACGILAKVREGRPLKLEGNESHPMNQGGLCARGQASLLNLYDPDRLRNPRIVSGHNGSYEDTDWQQVDEAIAERLSTIRKDGGKVVVLTGALTSPTISGIIADFLRQFAQGEHVSYEAVVPEEIGIAQELSYGERTTPRYRFDQAQLIVSFGADFLGTWLSPVEFAKGFSKARRADHGKMSRLVCIESALSLTGTNADHYAAVAPGEEVLVALALAHELIVQRSLTHLAADRTLVETLQPYSAERVAAIAGIKRETLKQIASELWAARGKSLVLGGAVKARHAVALQVAVNLLNSALENDGATIDWQLAPSRQAESSSKKLLTLISEMQQGKIAALFISAFDPVLTLPQSLGFTKAQSNISLVVSFATRTNETAKHCHYLCPDHHSLESWNDANPQRGLFSITQPLIAPLFSTRSFQDSLIQWGASSLPSWHDYLKNSWRQSIYPQASGFSSFEDFWQETLKQGFFDLHASARTDALQISAPRNFKNTSLRNLPGLESSPGNVFLSLVPSVTMFDGRSANNGWLQELPDPLSKITWDNYLSVAPKLADQLKLSEGDVVAVTTREAQATLPIHIQPKLSEKTVMIALGYGQSGIGRVGSSVGVNAYPFQTVENDFVEWGGWGVTLEKTGKNFPLATVQGHNDVAGRPIVFETTWTEFQKNPSSGIEHQAETTSMWPEHEYKQQRWGMAIDMNACIGCNACMVGCQSENNIPVVGKKQVLNGREMHWLRIDRYYSGDTHNPEVTYQPMLCQHCSHAPCETVCPTLATFHSDDGLNMMTYNRCVGTRYCSNNCPYKVRRFNFFEYTKNIVETERLMLNPDITTRTRGVMEKCTFCVQRIQLARDNAATEDERKIADGEIKTACQQSCPADAIIFGDLNDRESRVAHFAESKRGYHVLQELNTKPAITYLTKIRNRA